MMKHLIQSSVVALVASLSLHAADVGKPAPEFTGKTLKGEEVSLASLKGKVVVLEWVNFDCPFVKKHYASGNMPKLQESYADKGVVWLTVNSSAVGKQGHHETPKMIERADKEGNKATHFVMDTDGTIGRAYDAKVTPHMYVINKEGVLVYNGAMDSKGSTNAADIETADKYFVTALEAVLEGKEVKNAKNKPYGCGVKY